MDISFAPPIIDSDLATHGFLSVSLPHERWKPVLATDSIAVEVERLVIIHLRDLGRLLSTHYRGHRNRVGLLRPALDANGYLRTMILINGRYTTIKVHRVIAETWLRPFQPGETVNHLNFIRDDNRVVNLSIVTLKDNVRHSSAAGHYGKHCQGVMNPNAKLTPETVDAIRREWIPHQVLQRDLAKKYNVSRITIQRVLSRRGWHHVA